MDQDITGLCVYKSDRGNLVPDGLKPGEQVETEIFGYWLHTSRIRQKQLKRNEEECGTGKSSSFCIFKRKNP